MTDFCYCDWIRIVIVYCRVFYFIDSFKLKRFYRVFYFIDSLKRFGTTVNSKNQKRLIQLKRIWYGVNSKIF